MKVQMLTASASPTHIRLIGDIVEVGKEEGLDLIQGGFAVLVAQSSEVIARAIVDQVVVKEFEEAQDEEYETTEDIHSSEKAYSRKPSKKK